MRHMSRASHDENADMTLVIPMDSRCLRRLEWARLLCMTVWGKLSLSWYAQIGGGMQRNAITNGARKGQARAARRVPRPLTGTAGDGERAAIAQAQALRTMRGADSIHLGYWKPRSPKAYNVENVAREIP